MPLQRQHVHAMASFDDVLTAHQLQMHACRGWPEGRTRQGDDPVTRMLVQWLQTSLMQVFCWLF